jgi:hypothetical protein
MTTAAPPVPHPDLGRSRVVVRAPGSGPGYWAGGPSSAQADDGSIVLAYRLRRPVGKGRGFANVVARSTDGEVFETLTVLGSDEFGAESLERPCLVRRPDGGWRLYVSRATPGTLHWDVVAIDADRPDRFTAAGAIPVFAGDPVTAYKDPVVLHDGERWHAWVCCHEVGDPAEADAMYTRYAASEDGLRWAIGEPALAPRVGAWDARGTRIASVVQDGTGWLAYYDGRARADQNWSEQTGVAYGSTPDRFTTTADAPLAVSPDGGGGLRYLDVLPLADGAYRLFYEAARPDGAHDLLTEHVPADR